MQVIRDPRIYTNDYPESNIIIKQALSIINGTSIEQSLIEMLRNFLKNENDTIINVALNLSPNLSVTQKIWQCLIVAINQPDIAEYAEIFTIPLIVVTGSNKRVKLPNILNVDALNEFLYTNEVFSSDSDSFISGKLIEASAIQSIKASQQYYLVRNIKNAKLWLPLELEHNNMEVVGEAVFLRYLVGVSIVKNGKSGVNKYNFKKFSIQLMQFINKGLTTSGVTIFPIPFEPVLLTEALVIGNLKRTEIAIQVAFSNIVRKIREKNYTPKAYISTIIDAILLEITTQERSELKETSLWNLSKLDDFELIHQIIVDLLIDAQVEYEYK